MGIPAFRGGVIGIQLAELPSGSLAGLLKEKCRQAHFLETATSRLTLIREVVMKKLLLAGVGVMMIVGCTTDGRSPNVGVGVSVGDSAPPPVIREAPRGGPVIWVPAHGRRAKEVRQRYHYYPASGVYVNVSTGSHFYLNGGTWQVSTTLPSKVVLDKSNYVSLELDTDTPYLYYEEHKVKYKGHDSIKKHGHKKRRGKDKD